MDELDEIPECPDCSDKGGMCDNPHLENNMCFSLTLKAGYKYYMEISFNNFCTYFLLN